MITGRHNLFEDINIGRGLILMNILINLKHASIKMNVLDTN